ncbi:MFS transporter [Kozakia baliensis]|uniref:MFS transporter n=1 Tax=Kozakia baliensis TaxID=153496 RepID=UPI00087A944C|nr:MFS transporter [Kozakia baliensis]AOX21377.1 hypothetical protein A0U90_11090 [Kozakia baliensis]
MARVRIAPRLAQQYSTRAAFFIAGFSGAAWAALVPLAQRHTQIGNGALGLLLLCLGFGSVIAMPFAGKIIAKWGCRNTLLLSGLLLASMLPLLAFLSWVPALGVCLMLFGVGLGSMDAAMNVQALIVERSAGRPMMSGFHGIFSIGGVGGAGSMSALLHVGFSPEIASLSVACVVVLLLAISTPSNLQEGGESHHPVFVRPHGFIILLGGICFITFLSEGAVLDWGGVFLTSERHFPPTQGGWGYVLFSAAMTICRLMGDRGVKWLGRSRIVFLGGLIAASGFVIIVALDNVGIVLLGYALIGIGCANIVPVTYHALGRQKVMPESVAVSAVTAMGYAGGLAGPALIGLVAYLGGLSLAFGSLSILLVLVAACCSFVADRERR